MRGLNLPKERTFKGPASIFKRALAFLIDLSIINFIIFFPFRRLLQNVLPEESSFSLTYNFLKNNPELGTLLSITFMTMSFITILYFIILEKKLTQSIGKIILNINVASEKKHLKLWQLIVRNLFLIPIFPFILLWIIDPIFIILTKNKQRLSEILSKTKVIEQYKI
jgi:uncharacterized RDD family membrane protein YckC